VGRVTTGFWVVVVVGFAVVVGAAEELSVVVVVVVSAEELVVLDVGVPGAASLCWHAVTVAAVTPASSADRRTRRIRSYSIVVGSMSI
jgi:hypothetical protein